MNQKLTKRLVTTGAIAAIYAVLTLIIAPFAYGPIQFRISEVMVLLAFINPMYILGLTIGCLIANIAGGYGPMDIIFGSLATFISCVAIYWTRILLKNSKISIWIASIWPTIFNGIIIGWMLNVVIGAPFLLTVLQVGLGEFVVVTIVGVPIFNSIMNKYGNYFDKNSLSRT